ncbi:MAG: tetratricopeptide repeat protein, partial [Treponema sp.]|nr:tetratricopeptide repeat protein [Treponema sp.]
MTRKVFIGKFSNFIQLAVKLNEKSRRYGIASLENEVEDIDDEFFKQGLRLVIDKADKALINEILSNKIASEKNKNTRTFMKIQKRTVLAIHEGLGQRLLVLILLSLVKLPRKELHEIEWELFKDSPSDNNNIETDFDIADIEEKERSFDENFAIAKKCYTVGDRYRNNRNYEKAIKYFNDTAAADEEVNGKDNQSIAINLNQISTCYAKLKDFQNALKYSLEALAIREKILGTEHLDTACLYQKAADIYYLQDDIKNALVFY